MRFPLQASRCPRVVVRLALPCLVLHGLLAASLSAQSRGIVAGTVADQTGAPLYGVQVAVDGSQRLVTTDETGSFRLTDVGPGPLLLNARRLGFEPGKVEVVVSPGAVASVSFRLLPLAQRLSPVTVSTRRSDYYGRLAGFYERLEQRSGAHFITRHDIERQQPKTLGHALQRLPGVTLVRGRAGQTGVRLRGRSCWPLVWLDGIAMRAGDVDIDSFSPYGLEGVELYLGATGAPLRYTAMNDGSSCGTILLWTRSSDMEPKVPRSKVDELQRLVSTAAVFTAEQVSLPARLAPDVELDVSYPPTLFAAGVRGVVLAEFVVDTLGRVERATIGVVSATHPLFAEAVREALEGVSYTPAQREGRPVRQLVHQSFDFTPGRSGARR